MSVESREHLERSDLLSQLRIDRDGQPPRSRVRWLIVLAVALVVAAGGLWFGLGRMVAPTVQTVVARDAGPAAGPAPVLGPDGEVTARPAAAPPATRTATTT